MEQIINSDININQDEINKILNIFKLKFKSDFNLQTITDALLILMEEVGKIKKLKGTDKKTLVTNILIYIVKNTDIGTFDDVIDSVLINLIPILIDKLILVENGKIHFNKNSIKQNCFCLK